MNIVLGIFMTIFALGIVVLGYSLYTSEEGYEDENGFHSIKDKNKDKSKNDT